MNDKSFTPSASPLGDEYAVDSQAEESNLTERGYGPKPRLAFTIPAPPRLGKTRWRLSEQ